MAPNFFTKKSSLYPSIHKSIPTQFIPLDPPNSNRLPSNRLHLIPRYRIHTPISHLYQARPRLRLRLLLIPVPSSQTHPSSPSLSPHTSLAAPYTNSPPSANTSATSPHRTSSAFPAPGPSHAPSRTYLLLSAPDTRPSWRSHHPGWPIEA